MQPSTPNGEWKTRAPLKHARAAHAVVSTPTAIYALAGTGRGGQPVLEVERFDGKEWRAETALPGDGLNAPAAVVHAQQIYLMGGFNTTTNIPSEQVLIYDLVSRAWSHAAPLPAPRGGHAAAILDGRIHVAGGGNSSSTIADHSVYDPVGNTWAELAPLPRAEGSPALVALAGRLFAIGGRSGPSDFGDVFIYDPAADHWAAGTAIEPRGTAGAVVYRGTIHLFGGEAQATQTCLDSVLRLDLEQGVWTALKPMPTARNFARAVLFGDEVYVIGGCPTAGASHSSEGSTLSESFHGRAGK